MKKINLLIIVVMFVYSCTEHPFECKEEKIALKQYTNAEYDRAYDIARQHLLSMADMESDDLWDSESVIQQGEVLYTPGIEGVSYFEFPVKNGGKDAGYIMVTNGEFDSLIPEYSTEGKSITESYKTAVSSTAFDIVRFDYVYSAAKKGDKYIAENGFSGNNGIKGVETEDTRSGIEQMNVQMSAINATRVPSLDSRRSQITRSTTRGNGKTARIVSSPTTKKLQNSTPRWFQSQDSNQRDGYPAGCGSTAWAIVYGYHHQFKGKTNLFKMYTPPQYLSATDESLLKSKLTNDQYGDVLEFYNQQYGSYRFLDSQLIYPENFNSEEFVTASHLVSLLRSADTSMCTEVINLTDVMNFNLYSGNTGCFYNGSPQNKIWDVQWRLTAYLSGSYVYASNKKQTMILPQNMVNGKKYGIYQGGYSVEVDWMSFALTNTCRDFIWDSLGRDRPVIILINNAGTGVADHYVVVERMNYRYWENTGALTEFGLYCNFGNGGAPKWIYPYYDVASGHSGSFHSSYDIWTVKIQ